MISSIVKKEWQKLKFYLISLALFCLGVVVYFAYNLDFLFSTVEPESVMWYRFSHLEQKPYDYFAALFIIIAAVVSFAQFMPERIKNRIKIMAHLPISMHKSIFMHLAIGIFFISLLWIILTVLVGCVIYYYYTYNIFLVMLKDFSFFLLGASIFYVALSAAILESNKTISSLKLLLGIVFAFVFFRDRFFVVDIVWVLVFVVWCFVVLDSFYSIKSQRLKNKAFIAVAVLSIFFVAFQGYALYEDKYKRTFNKYFIFYSPILKEFVYQRNFGAHRFEYGTKDGRRFDRQEYESYLPFVYWRDLDIQKKLPIVIDNKEFDRETIRRSRLSFSYSPEFLEDKEVRFYPLINPDSKVGMIRFPEHMMQLNRLAIKAYNFDDGYNPELSSEINTLVREHGFKMPIVEIWGKATNMKPYDLGYMLLDSNDKLFNLRRRDSVVSFREIDIPKGVELKHITISENRQRKVAGYAIDSESNFYLIDWNFSFRKVELSGFDYKIKKLQFISNPKYYLIRYDDGETYHAVVFTRDFEKIDSVKFD